MKNLVVLLIVLVMIVSLLKTFHTPILQKMGDMLVYQDSLSNADAMIVLSGGAFERGNAGAEIFKTYAIKKIICPGGNIHYDALILYGDTVYESDITRLRIIQKGVPDSVLVALHEGTSTFEEAEEIKAYCATHSLTSSVIVSSLFHTARVHSVYKKVFRDSNIKICIRGAHSVRFDEKQWWKTEEGLIAFQNEVVKSIYYSLKY